MSAPERSESVVRFQAAAVLLATALGYAVMGLRIPRDTNVSPVVLFALPGVATLMFLLVTYLVPSVLAPRRIAFPLNVTLPVIYCTVLVVCVTLFTSSGTALFQVADALMLGRIWAQPGVLAQVAVSQMCALTVLAALSRMRVLS